LHLCYVRLTIKIPNRKIKSYANTDKRRSTAIVLAANSGLAHKGEVLAIWLLQHYIGNKKRVNLICRLPRHAIEKLNLNLKKSVKFMPKEFQRKKMDLDGFSYWKATQFRFFLHYCGPLVLYKILPKQMYRHFLLLFVACRILCDSELYIENVNYARELLVKFFELLPSFYGVDSQVMNSHNLIHLADDIEYTKTYLSNISAFPFENCLGKIK